MSQRSLKLFWCTTDENSCCGVPNCEDWFIVARNARQAAAQHESAEGFESGAAEAKMIVELPAEWQGVCMWCRNPWPKELLEGSGSLIDKRCTQCDAALVGWPSDEVMKACGGRPVRGQDAWILDGRKYAMGQELKA